MTADELAALHARAMDVPRPWRASEFSALLAVPQVHLNTAGTAFALGRTIGEEAELLTLATDPATRRRGLARRVLAGFERDAQQRGARAGFLEVAVTNAPALALYASAGWARAGLRRDYYDSADGRRIDAVVLCKPLFRT